MKIKIICILVMTLLISSTTTLAIKRNYNEQYQLENKFSIKSPPPWPVKFVKTFGGAYDDYGSCVQQTKDGGYIVLGATRSFGNGVERDVWLIKTNDTGIEMWNKTFGGPDWDEGYCVREITPDGYIITGFTWSYGSGLADLWLIKTDNLGNELWNKTFGGENFDCGHCVRQTKDGGYIITGYIEPSFPGEADVWLIKTDSSGNMIWDKTFDFGGTVQDAGYSVQQTTDDGYIIAGVIDGGLHAWLIKTNPDTGGSSYPGTTWDKIFGGPKADYAYSVQQTTPDGGYIITGATTSYGAGNGDLWLIKTHSDGTEEWNKTYGGPNYDGGYSVDQTYMGGYIITGGTTSYGSGQNDVWLIRTLSDGTEEWNKTYGGINIEEGHSVQQTTDEGYIIAGVSDSFGAGLYDVWLIKTELDGTSRNKTINNTFLNYLKNHPNLFLLLQRLFQRLIGLQ